MKKTPAFIVLLSAFFFGSVHAQQLNGSVEKPALTVSEQHFDFGKIPMGRPVTHRFSISNTGKDSIFIENVSASCGCTTPVWKKEPLAPGASSDIEVGYNAAAEGYFDKPVTIYYNQGKIMQVSVKGTVFVRNPTPVPANAAVAQLRQLNW